MLDLIIIAIGKIKEPYFKKAIDEYAKRLRPYAKIKIVELEAVPFTKANQEKAKNEEGKKIIKYLSKLPDKKVIALDEHGKEFNSSALAQHIFKTSGQIIFVIGGSLGLSKELLDKVDEKISLSRLTLPHEMARLILFEQIYRVVTIIKGKTYHY